MFFHNKNKLYIDERNCSIPLSTTAIKFFQTFSKFDYVREEEEQIQA